MATLAADAELEFETLTDGRQAHEVLDDNLGVFQL